jgi:hypothetical protein
MPSVFMLCERAIGLVRGRRLDGVNQGMLEALDYQGLTASNAQEEACTCIRHFAAVRDSLLHAYPWTFARKSGDLAQLTTPIKGWRYSHALPVDCARLLQLVWKHRTVAKWEEVGNVVGCEYRPVSARYTSKMDTPSTWVPLFCDAFVSRLAAEICVAVNGEFRVTPSLEESFQMTIREAYRVGIIDRGIRISLDEYKWDRYSNDWSTKYLGSWGE